MKKSFFESLKTISNKKGDSKLFPTFSSAAKKAKDAATKDITPNVGGAISNIAATDVSPYIKRGAGSVTSAAKGILGAPLKVAEGKGIIGALIPDWLKKLFVLLLKFIFGLTIILVVLVSGVAVWNYFQSGVGTSQVVHAQATVQQTGIPVIAELGLTNVYNAIFNPAALTTNYGFQSDIQKYNSDTDLGVKLVSIEQVGRPYYGQPVEVLGSFRTKSNENTKLVVSCQLADQDPIPAIVSGLQGPDDKPNELTMIKDQVQVIQAQCVFPQGFTPSSTTTVTTNGITPTTSAQTPVKGSETAQILVSFEFIQKASHNTYFMHSSELNSLLQINQDPFQYYKINDPQLTSDRKIISVATDGPLNLGIGTDISQPFVEKEPVGLGVTLGSNIAGGWTGNLKKLETLLIHVPPFISLEGDSDYGNGTQTIGQSLCDFDNTGTLDSDGFKVYTLKESVMANTNQQCNQLSLTQTNLTQQQCIDLYGNANGLTFRCNFKANSLPWAQGIKNDYIWAETSYIYEFKNEIAVDAYKQPGATA